MSMVNVIEYGICLCLLVSFMNQTNEVTQRSQKKSLFLHTLADSKGGVFISLMQAVQCQ